jgi:hypothetical protein
VFDPEEILTWKETMVGEPETPGPDIPLSIPVWEGETHKKCRPSLKKRLARKRRERGAMEKTRRVSDCNKYRPPSHVAGRGSKGQEVSPYKVVASPGIGRRVTDSNRPRLLPHVAREGSKGLQVSPYEVVASCGIGRGIRRGWGTERVPEPDPYMVRGAERVPEPDPYMVRDSHWHYDRARRRVGGSANLTASSFLSIGPRLQHQRYQ